MNIFFKRKKTRKSLRGGMPCFYFCKPMLASFFFLNNKKKTVKNKTGHAHTARRQMRTEKNKDIHTARRALGAWEEGALRWRERYGTYKNGFVVPMCCKALHPATGVWCCIWGIRANAAVLLQNGNSEKSSKIARWYPTVAFLQFNTSIQLRIMKPIPVSGNFNITTVATSYLQFNLPLLMGEPQYS